MGLSEEDRKRIEEEEYRRALREKYERELRGKAEVRADTTHQVDVRGVSAHFVQADTSHEVKVRGVTTEIYRDAKQGVRAGARLGVSLVGGFASAVAHFVVCVLGAALFTAAIVSPVSLLVLNESARPRSNSIGTVAVVIACLIGWYVLVGFVTVHLIRNSRAARSRRERRS